MDIYGYKDYRKMIGDWLQQVTDRGARSRLSEAAGCSPSWITRVLNGSVHFTPDQALAIAQYLELNEMESDYFMLLVELERASSQALRKRVERKLASLRAEGMQLRSSVRTDSTVSEENRILYYSSWVYSAVHVLCMIGSQTTEEIASRLKLSVAIVKGVVNELRGMGLIEMEGGKARATSKSIHLPSAHALSGVGHANWRQRTLQYFQEGEGSGFHYSAVHCLSREDMEKIRKMLKDAILSCRKSIESSPSETLGVLCLDWYGI